MAITNQYHSTVSFEAIELGMYAYDRYYWVSGRFDGATPQPA